MMFPFLCEEMDRKKSFLIFFQTHAVHSSHLAEQKMNRKRTKRKREKWWGEGESVKREGRGKMEGRESKRDREADTPRNTHKRRERKRRKNK